ncbi:MAG: hypothetical protein N3G21_13340 [Candidatus Hydrogenedentes bacterium]|nr:hypothetical protein [Candidatus Hydrogenedentota bacterium]
MGKRRTRKSVRRREEVFEEDKRVVEIPEPAWFFKVEPEDREIERILKTTPQADLLRECRGDKKRFWLVIFFSFILHLSVVTVFKIVVYVPRTDLQYMKLNLVQVDSPVILSKGSQLKISQRMEGTQWDDASLLPMEGLPKEVELPRLEFEEMKKLRLRRTLVEEDMEDRPLIEEFKDSWAQFGVGVNKIRESLSALYPFGADERIETKSREDFSPILVQDVGGGVKITYRFLEPPYNRRILFVPVSLELVNKIRDSSYKSYDFMIEINAEGDVLKVLDLNIERDEYSNSVSELVSNIKFEPLADLGLEKGIQQVTLKYSIGVGEK